jgi:AraC-like DNA-binding protein
VSEIAYEVGFQSLTHFNRVFRKLTGQVTVALPRVAAGLREKLSRVSRRKAAVG